LSQCRISNCASAKPFLYITVTVVWQTDRQIDRQCIIIIMKAKIIVTLYIKYVTGALNTVNYNENRLTV